MSSDKKTLLDSIFNYTPEKSKLQNFSTKADHAINSVINLLEYIDTEFGQDDADDLKKRLFLSIKNRDYKKFQRGLDNIALDEKRQSKGGRLDE
ncbi:hypothetical protein SEPL_109 [Salmonella phage SE_PL]|uniref:hypothetical protein n=1 Tax=Salmonella enterica TaxID=28901 RepID=UPI000FDF81A7|nr:hypothetical protein CPT_Munch_318 [Salmonella phage Munch]EAZ2022613.1 hypothetical protein [Salmonella enterica]ECV9083747.1 hypothetical protein [Salmonella enterica subsp. enterica serovar Infantis]MCP0435663.1 hypothetical protein [Salmonella enterica subsp. enterica serovar Mbandaka]QCW19015.1 hypothetical protein 7t3_0495 [Salmonella phage 7t3]QIG62722.1 hypothetical protein SEPL_109 [Salmonella phage SE_PL]WNV47425.1 hypothetical protein [Klebsiella phage fENko-Kae01]